MGRSMRLRGGRMHQNRADHLLEVSLSVAGTAIAAILLISASVGCVSRGSLPTFAFAPAPIAPPPRAPYRSEVPTSLVATSPLLEVTLIAGAGLPLVAISYPDPMPRGDDEDGRLLVLVAWPAAGEGRGDPGVAIRLMRADARLARSSLQSARAADMEDSALEIDTLVLCGELGNGLDELAQLIRDPRVRIRQLLHTGVAPRMRDGRVVLPETAVVELGEGRTLHTLAGESVLASGRHTAERYSRQIDSEPQLAALFAAALAAGDDVRIDRVFAGKPNLDWSLPRLGPGRPQLDVVMPGRDLIALADAVETERSARAVLDLTYEQFRFLLLGDLGRPGQEELVSLGAASGSWDSTCLLAPTLPGLEVSRHLLDQLDFQTGLGFGGDGGDRYSPALLVRRGRPETLHLTEALGQPHHLRVTTDGVIFQIVALPVEGGEARPLNPWQRCLGSRELDGLCDRESPRAGIR